MSIFVRQLGAITCEVKFDRHCNWIVTVIAWNVPFPPASLILDAHSCRENKGFGYYTTLGSLRQQDGKLEFFAVECVSVSKCGALKVCGI